MLEKVLIAEQGSQAAAQSKWKFDGLSLLSG